MAYEKLLEIRHVRTVDNTMIIERLKGLGAPEKILPPQTEDALGIIIEKVRELGLTTVCYNASLFHQYNEQCFSYLQYTSRPPKMLLAMLKDLQERGIIQTYTMDRGEMNFLGK